jgi:hypothetical protein
MWSGEGILMLTTLKCEICVRNLVAKSALVLNVPSTANATTRKSHWNV